MIECVHICKCVCVSAHTYLGSVSTFDEHVSPVPRAHVCARSLQEVDTPAWGGSSMARGCPGPPSGMVWAQTLLSCSPWGPTGRHFPSGSAGRGEGSPQPRQPQGTHAPTPPLHPPPPELPGPPLGIRLCPGSSGCRSEGQKQKENRKPSRGPACPACLGLTAPSQVPAEGWQLSSPSRELMS